MRYLLPALLVLSLASFCFAISTDEIVRLSTMKTSDELLIQIIQKDGLDKPVTSKDVVYLKEKGVSDRVIQYLIKLSNPEKQKMLPQEGKSEWISENMRAYYTTAKNGKRIRVVTNLDEHGKRIGGEVPPQPEAAPQQEPSYAYEAPREIRVVVEQPQEREEPQEYVQDQYVNNGIPINGGYYPSYYSPYIPYYPYSFPHPHKFHRFPNQNQQDTTIAIHRPLTNPRPPAHMTKPVPGSSAGARRLR